MMGCFDLDQEPSGTLLFLIPREEDYITPLLTPWSYQAMIHEYLGLRRNRLVLQNEKEKNFLTEILSSLEQTIVSCYTDSFFANHWMCDFGKTAGDVQQMLEKYKETCTALHKSNFNTVKETIPSIYTTLQQEQTMVSRHIEILNAMNKQIQDRQLVDVSRYEQDMVCNNKPEKHYDELCHMLDSPSLCIKDKIRLAHLFYLRYSSNPLSEKVYEKIQYICREDPKCLESLKIVRKMMLDGCYRSKNTTYGKEGLFQLACNVVKRGLNPACQENFSQHRSFVTNFVESVLKNKSIQGYNYNLSSFVSSPVCEIKTSSTTLLSHILKDSKQQMIDICVFFIGGATYQEAAELHHLSKAYNCSITVGGTTLHNSQSFLNAISNLQSSTETTQMSTLSNTCFQKSFVTSFQQPTSLTPVKEASTHKELIFANKKKFLHELW
jgi:vacuolar protein sorting-associated protein 45